MSDGREQAERSADGIRAELLVTLRELNRRRHRALDFRYQVDHHFALFAAIAVGAMLAAGAVVTFGLVRARLRRESLFAERIRGLMRAWENPESIARPPSAHLLSAGTLRKLGALAAIALAKQMAQRGARRLLHSNAPVIH